MRLNERMLSEVVGEPRVVIKGREEALIERHRGLLAYDPRCVRARCGAYEVRVDGESLTIPFFGLEDMIVAGKIASVSFLECAP